MAVLPPPPPREASASHAGDRRGARVTVFVFFCSFLLLFTPLLSRVTLPRYSFEMQNITPALPASHLFSFSLLLVSNNIMLDNYRARNCHWATAELFPEWCSYRIWRPQCTELKRRAKCKMDYIVLDHYDQWILGFHCHAIENKIANHSVQKVQNLGNKRR